MADTDILIKDGDIALDMTGNPVYIDGMDEIVQRVAMRLSAARKGFAYNGELKSECADADISTPRGLKNLEALMREAAAPVKGSRLRLLSAQRRGDTLHITAEVTYGGLTAEAEVTI